MAFRYLIKMQNSFSLFRCFFFWGGGGETLFVIQRNFFLTMYEHFFWGDKQFSSKETHMALLSNFS